MPMRAYRASTAFAGAHVRDNLWFWVIVFTLATIALAVASGLAPKVGVWAHLVTLAGMFLGTLLMIKSQEGYVPPDMPDDDDELVQPMA